MCPLLDFSVLEDMPLYDILNEFQKGHSHMAVVIRKKNPSYQTAEQAANDGGTFGELLCSCYTLLVILSNSHLLCIIFSICLTLFAFFSLGVEQRGVHCY